MITSYVWCSQSILTLFLLSTLVQADCQCGYSTNTNDTTRVFTDLLETNFLHLRSIESNTDWIRQEFNVTAAASRGTYGTSFQVDNVIGNPLTNSSAWLGPGINAGDAGLQLYVRGEIPLDGLVPTSEIDSARADIRFGSMRAAMKLSAVTGTCGAFFWVCLRDSYLNHRQVIRRND